MLNLYIFGLSNKRKPPMPIQSISLNNVTFKGETQKTEEPDVIDVQKEAEKPVDDNAKKITLALGGLAAVGIGAVLISRSKKVPQELSIEEFKKIGKFDKGIAKAKGKLFTGAIDVPAKDGKFIIEYENGVLKQSTKYLTTELPGLKPFLMPGTKKVYSTNDDGAKTVQTYLYNKYYQTFGGKEWGNIGTTTSSKDKVIVERINSLTGDALQDVSVKQQDGSWFKTTQEIDFNFSEPGKRRILTKNAKTDEVLKSEIKTVKVSTAPERKTPASDGQKRAFNL